MKKKYQVFVSSTFIDLKDERQAASKAILNLGHIPAGMELFPAADIDQMSFIKRVIDDCDYYILIIGGRYGSTTDEGLSYTELEYNYAVEAKKPVLAFLHPDINELKSRNVESDPEKMQRLVNFKSKISSGRLVEYWNDIEGLEAKVLISLTAAFNDQPQIGWRRDDGELGEVAAKRLHAIQTQYESARLRADEAQRRVLSAENRISDYENIQEAEIEIRYLAEEQPHTTTFSAEQVIREFASDLVEGLSDEVVRAGLYELILHKVNKEVTDVAEVSIRNVTLFFEVFEIASRERGPLMIRDEKKWLLKAAFKPLGKVIEDNDSAIPF